MNNELISSNERVIVLSLMARIRDAQPKKGHVCTEANVEFNLE